MTAEFDLLKTRVQALEAAYVALKNGINAPEADLEGIKSLAAEVDATLNPPAPTPAPAT